MQVYNKQLHHWSSTWINTNWPENLSLCAERTLMLTLVWKYVLAARLLENMACRKLWNDIAIMELLPDTKNNGLRMRRECGEQFPCHRGLAIPTCITTRAWRTWRGACGELSVSFEVGGGENVTGIPGACAIHKLAYLAKGPLRSWLSDWWLYSVTLYHLRIVFARNVGGIFIKYTLLYTHFVIHMQHTYTSFKICA